MSSNMCGGSSASILEVPNIFQCPEVGLQPARRRLFLGALSGGALRREIAFERSPGEAWLQQEIATGSEK